MKVELSPAAPADRMDIAICEGIHMLPYERYIVFYRAVAEAPIKLQVLVEKQ